jgi:hypothetical protein
MSEISKDVLQSVAAVVKHIYPQAAEIHLSGDARQPVHYVKDSLGNTLPMPTNAQLQIAYVAWAAEVAAEEASRVVPVETQIATLRAQLDALEKQVKG